MANRRSSLLFFQLVDHFFSAWVGGMHHTAMALQYTSRKHLKLDYTSPEPNFVTKLFLGKMFFFVIIYNFYIYSCARQGRLELLVSSM